MPCLQWGCRWNEKGKKEWYRLSDLVREREEIFGEYGWPRGVYVIWRGDQARTVIRVGQGYISDRLAHHSKDQNILQHTEGYDLYASWVVISDLNERNSIERYLGNTLIPLVGVNFPNVAPLVVNTPWEKCVDK